MAAKMSGLRIDTGVIDSLNFYDTTPTLSPTERKTSDVFQASSLRSPVESPRSIATPLGEKRYFHDFLEPGDTVADIYKKLKATPNLQSLHILNSEEYSNNDLARLAGSMKVMQARGMLPLFDQLVIEGPFSNNANQITYQGIVTLFKDCKIKDLVVCNCDLNDIYKYTDFPDAENLHISTPELMGALQNLDSSRLHLPNLTTLWVINYCLVGSLNRQVTDLLVAGECLLGLPYSVKKLAFLNRGEFDFNEFFKMLAQNPQLEYVQLDVDIGLCSFYICDYFKTGSVTMVDLVRNKSYKPLENSPFFVIQQTAASSGVLSLKIVDMDSRVEMFYEKLKLKGYAKPTAFSRVQRTLLPRAQSRS